MTTYFRICSLYMTEELRQRQKKVSFYTIEYIQYRMVKCDRKRKNMGQLCQLIQLRMGRKSDRYN